MLARLVLLVTTVAASIAWAAGSLDPAFGHGGQISTFIGTGDAQARDVAVQTDGKIVAAGIATGPVFVLARYTVDGTPDPGFGSGGITTTAVGPNSGAEALAIQPDGRIVLVGFGGSGFGVVRYTESGNLDETFGAGGIVSTNIGVGSVAHAYAVAIQPDRKLVVAGTAYVGSNYAFALARYTEDGALDGSFGSGGIVTTSLAGAGDDYAYDVIIQPDGKIVAAGLSICCGGNAIALVRYNIDGTLDLAFGAGGISTTTFGSSPARAEAVRLQADNKLVVAGNDGVARFNVDGSVDPNFGTGGIVRNNLGFLNDVELQPDGGIIAAGGSDAFSAAGFVFVRYDPSGVPDPTFGVAGVVTTTVGEHNAAAHGVAVQPDGKIVAAGVASSYSPVPHGVLALVRLQAETAAPADCGDGLVQPGEECDLGISNAPTSCCSSACEFRERGSFCHDDLEPCQDSCDSAGSCRISWPGRSACSPPATTSVRLRAGAQRRSSSAKWAWRDDRTGPVVTPGDFGNPVDGTRFALCVIESTAHGPRVAMVTRVPHAGLCGDRPCWSVLSDGYRFNGPGIRLHLQYGMSKPAKITAKATGEDAGLASDFPLALPVALRLRRNDAPTCWETYVSQPIKNSSTQFTERF